MPKLRYAIAALFFAASVGCLALWWRSYSVRYEAAGPSHVLPSHAIFLGAVRGFGIAGMTKEIPPFTHKTWTVNSFSVSGNMGGFYAAVESHGSFGPFRNWWYFPLWYASLIFALAGVGALRFRRQFSIRSALIGLAVVAALLGMVVAL